MITRAHMRRQLRATGGITNARQGYGIGSWVKEKVRKIIPNELANIASKAAPFVAPFYPGAAAAMRGIGRFDKRGSISDAMKQAALTYAGGKGARYLGGVDKSLMPGQGTTGFDYSMDKFRKGPVGRTWDRIMPERQSKNLTRSIDSGRGGDSASALSRKVANLPTTVPDKFSVEGIWNKFQSMSPGMRTAIVGVGTGAITGVAQWFENQYRAQKPGETIEEYLAARKKDVGKLMRTYMDNYYAHDATYSALDDAGKDAFVAKYNMNKGGRVGYRYGGGGADYMPLPEGPRGNPAVIEEIEDMREFMIANPGIEDVADYSLEYPPKNENMVIPKNRLDPRNMTTQQLISIIKSGRYTPEMFEELRKRGIDYDMAKGGRVGYQTGGISMGNTLAQNRAINNAQRAANQATLQQGRNTQQATGILDAAMRSADPNDPGGSLTNIYNKYFYGKNTGVPAGTFNMGNRKMSYTSSERDNIIRGIASQLGNQTTYRPTPPTDSLTGMLQSQMLPNNPDGSMKSLAEQNAIRDRVLAAQAAQEGNKPTFQEVLMGEEWNMLSDNDQYRISQEYPGQTPPRRNPDFVPSMNQGGRVGYAIGSPEKQLEAGAPPIIYEGNMDPRAQNQQAGLPSIPGPIRMAKDGPEFDMRQRGGFQPLGRQEGKDDVPAMLAKNEFVMTADAVRAAGGGSIQKGAQRMYDTMKKLERRVS